MRYAGQHLDPDGRGGGIDGEGRHYPFPVGRPDYWSNPASEIERPVKSGDIIETSMPFSVDGDGPFGWQVWHHRVTLTVQEPEIQDLADGMQQEWAQAFGSGSASRFVHSPMMGNGLVVGPCRVQNLSSPSDEAVATQTWRSSQQHPPGNELLPLRAAVLVRKHTALFGRGGLGYFRLPGAAEYAQVAGHLTAEAITYFTNAYSDLANFTDIGNLTGSRAALVLYHRGASEKSGAVETTPVDSVSCASVMSSVRDRVRVSS